MPVVLSLHHTDGYIMAFLTGANEIGLIAAFVFSWMIPPSVKLWEAPKWW